MLFVCPLLLPDEPGGEECLYLLSEEDADPGIPDDVEARSWSSTRLLRLRLSSMPYAHLLLLLPK